MITILLMGGLGNQLFQIFATIAYAIEHKHRFIFPFSEKLGQRITYWDTFLHNLKTFTTYNGRFNYTNEQLREFTKISEVEFQYHKIERVDPDKSFTLYGYFQSHKYFEDYKDQIYRIIHLEEHKNNIREDFKQYLETDKHIVSMHFRLGDYKLLPNYHPILSENYYRQALEKIVERRQNIRVLYFCEKEDNSHVTNIINNLNNTYSEIEFIKVDDAVDDWKQMLLMSLCHDNIIANSSFSWWGAYFNENIEKNIYYPNIWFGYMLSYLKTPDLYPDEWHKIEIK